MSENATKWFFDKMEVQSNVHMHGNTSRWILIDNVTIENAGYYYCYGKSNISSKYFLSSAILILWGKFILMNGTT